MLSFNEARKALYPNADALKNVILKDNKGLTSLVGIYRCVN